MANAADMQSAQNEISSVDRQINALNAQEASAAHHLCRSISVLDANSNVNRQLRSASAADRNLRELAKMSINLGQSYVDNALNLDREADLSVSLAKTNSWLTYCYFMIGLSKAMDAYAQYLGGPAKLITELKTPITDIGKSLADSKRPKGQVEALPVAQSVNLTLIEILTIFPDGKKLADLQKGLAATIEFIKDLADLWKRRNSVPGGWSADWKTGAAETLEMVSKLIDLANRVLTGYDVTPRLAPDAVKNLVPDRIRQLPAIDKGKLDKIKAWISGVKYTLEAFASFLRSYVSLLDFLESKRAANESGNLALQQLAPTDGGSIDLRVEIFAAATKHDLVNLVHGVNSAADAEQLARAAISRIRGLKTEIERLGQYHERQLRFLHYDLENVARLKSQLRESDRKLDEFHRSIATLAPNASIFDGRMVARDDLLSRIDSARGRISRLINPQPPKWVSPRGRFGPRMGTM